MIKMEYPRILPFTSTEIKVQDPFILERITAFVTIIESPTYQTLKRQLNQLEAEAEERRRVLDYWGTQWGSSQVDIFYGKIAEWIRKIAVKLNQAKTREEIYNIANLYKKDS